MTKNLYTRFISMLLTLAVMMGLVVPAAYAAESDDAPTNVKVHYSDAYDYRGSYYSDNLQSKVNIRTIRTSYEYGGKDVDSYSFCLEHGDGLSSKDTYTYAGELKDYPAAPFIAFMINGSRVHGWDSATVQSVQGWVNAVVWLVQAGMFTDATDPAQIEMAANERLASLNTVFPGTTHTLQSSIDLLNMIVAGYNQGDYGNWHFYQYNTNNSANQNMLIGEQELVQNRFPIYVQLEKTSDSSAALSGAEFTVYENGIERGQITTDSTGHGTSNEIVLTQPTATLTVVETKAPVGYSLDGKIYTVQVDSAKNGTPSTAAEVNNGNPIENEPVIIPQEYVILKTDAKTDEPLAGATFQLENVVTQQTYDLVTDNSGTIPLQWSDASGENYIVPGTYTVTETNPPPGYSAVNNPVQTLTFALTWNAERGFWEQNDPGQLKYENPKDNTIRFTKIDEDGDIINGGKFDVYQDGTLLGQYEGGQFTISDLKTGFYIVKEVTPPAGYVLPANPYASVYVDVDDTATDTYYLTLINYDYPDIQIRKSDPTGLGLSGAIFDVKIDATSIGQVTTNSIGVATISYAQYGDFLSSANNSWTVTATEVKAPEGYTLSEPTTVTAEIQKGQDLATLEFVNDPIPKIQIAKIDSATGEPLANAEFTVYIDGHNIGSFYSDEDGIVSLDYTDYGNHLDITADSWVIKVEETDAAPNYDLSDVPVQEMTVVRGQTTASFTFGNYQYPSIEIYKTDKTTNRPLAGSLFRVAIDTQELGYFTTGADGKILISYADYYEYIGVGVDNEWTVTVEEVRAPSGYLLNKDNTKSAVLNRNQGLVKFDFQNDIYPELHILKTDTNGNPLANTLFSVSIDGTAFGDFWTDALGKITLTHDQYGDFLSDSGADSWTVTVAEKQPAAGYLLSGKSVVTQEIKRGQEVAEFKFANHEVPEIQILKTDSATGDPLANAEFEVSIDGKSIGSFYSDADGLVLLDETNYGNTFDLTADEWMFTVTEKNPPSGFALNYETTQSVTVTAGQLLVPFNFSNYEYPEIKIVKIDAKTNEPLDGAVFRVSVDTQIFGTFITNEDGEIIITYDEYYEFLGREKDSWTVQVEELSAPGGYLINGNIQSAELRRNQGLITFSFTNSEYPAIVIEKRSSVTNELLEGATFEVTIDGAHVGSFDTDENGRIIIAHQQYGDYLGNDTNDGWTIVVTETKAPDGYHDATEPTQQAQMYRGQALAPFVFTNIPRSDLLITKVDSTDESPLAGVTFEVKRDTTSIGTFVTDAKGEILLEDLEVGTYTVRETKTVAGYVLNDTPKTVEVKLNDNIFLYKLHFENDRQPTLTVNKVDSITGEPILGALFQVTYQHSKTSTGEERNLGKFYTDADGQFHLPALDEGWYTVTEIEPADGYSLKEPLTQELHLSGNENAEMTFENIPLSALVIKKVDADTGEVLQGAKFKVSYLAGTSGTGGTVIGTYETGVNGTITITGLEAGNYIIQETKAPSGYIIDDAPETVYLSGETQDVVSVEFENQKKGNLVIEKIDSVTGEPLKGATFEVITSDGAFVGNYDGTVTSNGKYTTDEKGQIHITTLDPATYVVTEIKAPDGYILDGKSQTVRVNTNDTQTLTFENTPIGGLQIIKKDADSGARIRGVEFEIRKMNGEMIGQYTTNSLGMIHLGELESGWYQIQEIEPAAGYLPNDTLYTVEVKDGDTAVLTVKNEKASGILIHKVDSRSGDGLYGATFLLYDSGKNPIGQYTSDQSGYVYIDEDELSAGRYYLREIDAPEGYALDDTLKTVYVKAGKTIEIEWENDPILGQIQITKYSSEDNAITGEKAGTALEGAVFEISNARSGSVVGYIVTDARGVAASKPLPLGRYLIKEVTAPAYYAASNKTYEAELEYEDQIVKLTAFNSSVNLGVTIKKVGNQMVIPGDSMRYEFSQIANTSNVPLGGFFWHDRLPTDAVRAMTLTTGTYNARLNYRIVYQTNYHDYRVLVSNLLSSNEYSFNLSDAVLGLMSGEYVTDIRFEFGTVPSGFASVKNPLMTVSVLPTVPNGYQITNRADIGGSYLGQWQTATTTWITITKKLTPDPELPRTGY